MSKYNIGDWVKVVKQPLGCSSLGGEGLVFKVTEVSIDSKSDNCYRYTLGGIYSQTVGNIHWKAEEIEPYKVTFDSIFDPNVYMGVLCTSDIDIKHLCYEYNKHIGPTGTSHMTAPDLHVLNTPGGVLVAVFQGGKFARFLPMALTGVNSLTELPIISYQKLMRTPLNYRTGTLLTAKQYKQEDTNMEKCKFGITHTERIDTTNNTKIPVTITWAIGVDGDKALTMCDDSCYDMYTGALVAAAKITAGTSNESRMLYNIARNTWGTDISKTILLELANNAFGGYFKHHYEKWVKNNITKFVCPLCHKTFLTESELVEHTKWHEERRARRKQLRSVRSSAKKIAADTINHILTMNMAHDIMVEMLEDEIKKVPNRLSKKYLETIENCLKIYGAFTQEQKCKLSTESQAKIEKFGKYISKKGQ